MSKRLRLRIRVEWIRPSITNRIRPPEENKPDPTVWVKNPRILTQPGSGSYRVLNLKNHNLRLFFDTKVKIIDKLMLYHIFGELIFEAKV